MVNAQARQLRQNLTEAEKRLWVYLRTLKADGFHFRRQAPIGAYVTDFCCHGAKIVIEVDGGQHNTEEGRVQDRARTDWLATRGYRVLRFWNNDVLMNTEGVMAEVLSSLHPHPNPSPQGGGAMNNDRA